jgi:hypothetical protein
MGASNAIAAYRLYGSKIPPKSMLVLNWMALVSLDKDTEPWWSQGHAELAKMPLGRPEPITAADLRAVARAITPLFEVGAITVARHSSGRPGNPLHVRYRLWLTRPAPDENRRVENKAAHDENRLTPDPGTRREVVEHTTKSDEAPDENRRTKEYEDQEERIKEQEYPAPVVGIGTGIARAGLADEGRISSQARVNGKSASRWRDDREAAAEQAAESRRRREAAERQAGAVAP